jgi:hypothetical protein
MIRPSWLIFTGRGRQAKIAGFAHRVHWLVALDRRASFAADRDRDRDSDQARFARPGFLQAGASR